MITVKFFVRDPSTKETITSSLIYLPDEYMLDERIEAQRLVLKRAMPNCTVVALVENKEIV